MHFHVTRQLSYLSLARNDFLAAALNPRIDM